MVAGSEAGVDDAGVRAGRQHRDTTATHLRGNEALIHDLRVRRPARAAERVVAFESGLVARAPCDGAAGEEQPAGEQVCLLVAFDRTAGLVQGVEGGLLGSIAITPDGVITPRWSGRSGWTSTTGAPRPASRRASLMAARATGSPPLWSQCQCERKIVSISEMSMPRRAALSTQTSPYGPTSNNTLRRRLPTCPVSSTENPWQATHR